MKSLRSQLLFKILTGTFVLLIITLFSLDGYIRTYLETEFDESLLQKIRTLVTLTTQKEGAIEFDFADEFMPEFEAEEDPQYFQLWLGNNVVLERSHSLGESDLPHAAIEPGNHLISNFVLPDGRSGKLVQVTFIPHKKDDEEEVADASSDPATKGEMIDALYASFSMARSREELDTVIINSRITLAIVLCVLMVSIALLVNFTVYRVLRPLQIIRRHVMKLDANKLDKRIGMPVYIAEVAPVIDQLNKLMDRLEDSFQRERRFSGNVAHELRNPIAEMRSIAEVGRKWPEDTEMATRFFDDLLEISTDMEAIVTNLLMLAHCDSGALAVEQSAFQFSEVVNSSLMRSRKESEHKKLQLEQKTQGGVCLVSDRQKLSLIITNLLSNAVSYSPDGGRITIRTNVVDEKAQISVENIAPNLKDADMDMVFERFWRKEQTRDDNHHVGLGLSLVASLATLLDFSIEAELTPKHVFRITLSNIPTQQAAC